MGSKYFRGFPAVEPFYCIFDGNLSFDYKNWKRNLVVALIPFRWLLKTEAGLIGKKGQEIFENFLDKWENFESESLYRYGLLKTVLGYWTKAEILKRIE